MAIAGQEVVAGELGPGSPVLAFGLREAFNPVGHVGHADRPLHSGNRASAMERGRGDVIGQIRAPFRPNLDFRERAQGLFVNVYGG